MKIDFLWPKIIKQRARDSWHYNWGTISPTCEFQRQSFLRLLLFSCSRKSNMVYLWLVFKVCFAWDILYLYFWILVNHFHFLVFYFFYSLHDAAIMNCSNCCFPSRCHLQAIVLAREFRVFCTKWCSFAFPWSWTAQLKFDCAVQNQKVIQCRGRNSVNSITTNKVRLFANPTGSDCAHLNITYTQANLRQNLQLQVSFEYTLHSNGHNQAF